MSEDPKKMINGFGAIAVAALAMYRSAMNAGGTREKAKDIVTAYFDATLKYGKNIREENAKKAGREEYDSV